MTQDQPSYFDLELLAAQLRKHSDDLSLYAGFLLNVLSAALPGEIVTVKREGKIKARLGGRSEPAVLAVSVHLGDRRYHLERAEFGRPLTAIDPARVGRRRAVDQDGHDRRVVARAWPPS